VEAHFELSERERAVRGQAIYTICHRAGIDWNGLACPYCLHRDICPGSRMTEGKRPATEIAPPDPFDVAA